MTRRTPLVAWLAALWSAACGLSPAPPAVPVEGPRADRAALSGDWSGRYWADATPRHGILNFGLRAGSDTARGEVQMSFAPALRLYGEDPEAPLARHPCRRLDITVVRVAGDSVRGILAPYWDPDCDCRTHTLFEGRLVRDSIGGTFISRRESRDLPLLTGRWYALRE